jgi:DNA-binding NarL/FixJ family response regulator
MRASTGALYRVHAYRRSCRLSINRAGSKHWTLPGSAGTLAFVVEVLSRRELEVLQLVALGASNSQVAETLALSIHTVKKHIARLLLKLKAESRSEAARLYRESITQQPPTSEPAGAHALGDLTTRERDVLSRIASGANNQRIAAELALSLNTIKRHTTRIYSKLGVRSRVRAAALLHASAQANPA